MKERVFAHTKLRAREALPDGENAGGDV